MLLFCAAWTDGIATPASAEAAAKRPVLFKNSRRVVGVAGELFIRSSVWRCGMATHGNLFFCFDLKHSNGGIVPQCKCFSSPEKPDLVFALRKAVAMVFCTGRRRLMISTLEGWA